MIKNEKKMENDRDKRLADQFGRTVNRRRAYQIGKHNIQFSDDIPFVYIFFPPFSFQSLKKIKTVSDKYIVQIQIFFYCCDLNFQTA